MYILETFEYDKNINPVSFLTTRYWLTHQAFLYEDDYPISEIATFVGNNVSFGKPLKCSAKYYEDSSIYALGDLCLVTEEQMIYYTKNQDDWDFDFAPISDLMDQEVYIGKCIYIPDNLNITQDAQDDIMLAKLNAIIYNFAESMGDDYIIFNDKSHKYIQDITEVCGYLNIKIENYHNDKLIISDLDPVIMNLNPLINFDYGDHSELVLYFPTWLYNSHPYAQREFLKLILKINFSDLKAALKFGHLINLQYLGVRCGMPIDIINKNIVTTSKMKKSKIKKIADKKTFQAASIKIEPTNILLYHNNRECFVNCG